MKLLEKWPHERLGDICRKIGSGATPRGGENVYQTDGPAIIRSQNVYNGQFTFEGLARLSEEHAEELEGVTVEANDVLLNITGDSVARCCQVAIIRPVPESVLPARVNQHDRERLNPRFLSYYLISPLMQTYLLSIAGSGGTRKALTKGMIEDFQVPCPASSVQNRIVGILSAYDDMIENNRRRMALLEESARYLYQEWFVRLRFPGYEHSHAIDGVPEGWERMPLMRLIDVKHGYAFLGPYFSDDATSRVLMTPGNFAIGGGLKIDKLKYYSEDGPLDGAYVLQPMDLALTMTDLSKDSDTLGYPALIPRITGQFLHNQRIGKVTPKTDFFPRFFLYCLFCDRRYRHHVVGSASGTSVKHTSPGRILAYSILIPENRRLINEFDDLTQPFFQQINCLTETNEKLRTARDLLLPRLMSGEVAV